jgi:hypothetical protein
VEEFVDKTVERLSSSPKKGIFVDLEGVKSVCSDFSTRQYIFNNIVDEFERDTEEWSG